MGYTEEAMLNNNYVDSSFCAPSMSRPQMLGSKFSYVTFILLISDKFLNHHKIGCKSHLQTL